MKLPNPFAPLLALFGRAKPLADGAAAGAKKPWLLRLVLIVLALALLVGIALAFVADYIDPTVRHRADALELGLPLIGQIPARRTWWRWLPLHRRLP